MPKGWVSAQWTCCWRQGGYFRLHLELFFQEGVCACMCFGRGVNLCPHLSCKAVTSLFRQGWRARDACPTLRWHEWLVLSRPFFFFPLHACLSSTEMYFLPCLVVAFCSKVWRWRFPFKKRKKRWKPSSRQQLCQGGLELKICKGNKVPWN